MRQDDLRTVEVWTDGASAAYKACSADDRWESRAVRVQAVFHDEHHLFPCHRSRSPSLSPSSSSTASYCRAVVNGQCSIVELQAIAIRGDGNLQIMGHEKRRDLQMLTARHSWYCKVTPCTYEREEWISTHICTTGTAGRGIVPKTFLSQARRSAAWSSPIS